jgi:hypothetical protein
MTTPPIKVEGFADITEEYLLKSHESIVWMRDDYLSMRCWADDPVQKYYLDKVAEMKQNMRDRGITFNC